MRRLAGLLVGVALALTCGEDKLAEDECAALCEFAAHCHFLPSSLGGQAGDDYEALRADCAHRCRNTPAGDPAIAALGGCLRGGDFDVCDVRRCVEAAACVREDPLIPDEVLGRADVIIRLLDGVYWSANFVPELCAQTNMISDNYFGLDHYCEAIAAEKTPQVYECGGAREQPALCTAADCEEAKECDPSMCNRSYVTAAADCRYYGITSVQLGYRDESGAMVFSPRSLTCEEASAGERFEAVPYGVITPVALYHGELTAAAADDLSSDAVKIPAGRPFCWASWPLSPARLTPSGESTLVVPTPSNIQLLDEIRERDKEFPVGCGCAFDTIDCEALDDECDNGLDDDEDGLIDMAEDPGCAPEGECSNGEDDDDDGKTDLEDPDCSICGDGMVGPGEECDDGGVAVGDGCDDRCRLE